MPTRRSLKDSSPEKPQEGKANSARPRAKGKRVASVHAPAPVKENEEKPASSQEELASALSGQGQEAAAAQSSEPSVQQNEAQAKDQIASQETDGEGQEPVSAQEPSASSEQKKAPSKRPSAKGKRARATVATDASGDAQDQKAEKGAPKRRSAQKGKKSPVRIILAALVGVLLALVVVAAAFAVDRWMLHDDAADLQGTWYLYDTQVAVPIDDKNIGISSDTKYKYTIDTQAKTVTYSLGNLVGTSHYRFSSDRSQVALMEDGKKVFTATLFDDISWWFSSLGNAIMGKPVLPGPQASNVVMLSRTPAVPDPVVVEDEEVPGEGEEAPAEGEEIPDDSEKTASEEETNIVQEPVLQESSNDSPAEG